MLCLKAELKCDYLQPQRNQAKASGAAQQHLQVIMIVTSVMAATVRRTTTPACTESLLRLYPQPPTSPFTYPAIYRACETAISSPSICFAPPDSVTAAPTHTHKWDLNLHLFFAYSIFHSFSSSSPIRPSCGENFTQMQLFFLFPPHSVWQLGLNHEGSRFVIPKNESWQEHTSASGWRSAALSLPTLWDFRISKLQFSSPAEVEPNRPNPRMCLIHIFELRLKMVCVLEMKSNSSRGLMWTEISHSVQIQSSLGFMVLH